MNFTHLHCHGSYSLLDGLGTPEKMAQAAKDLGFQALGITDHGNIDCFVKWQKACLDIGINPIFGCEMYIDENRFETGKEARRYHVCFFVKNQIGFENLQKLLTIANLEGFAKKPRIDPDSVLKNCDGLIMSTACLASFVQTVWGKKFLKQFARQNPGDIYYEIMPIDVDRQVDFNLEIIQLAQKMGGKIIATNDVHYIKKEDEELQEVLLCINSADKISNPNRFKFECKTHYMCTAKEMLGMFRRNHPDIDMRLVKQAMNNTQEIVDKCKDFRLMKYPVVLPLIPQCAEGQEEEFLSNLIFAGLRKKIKQGKIDKKRLPEYRSRIDEEFALLKDKKFVRYFLVVWEFIEWCRKNDIAVGPGRGSAGGSIIAYLIDIVQVDPLKYDLLFARFISPSRNDLPDIDCDFQDTERHRVREHVQELYGVNNVAGISTFVSIKGKGSFRDVCRVFDIPNKEVNEVSKLLDDEDDLTLDSFNNSEFEEVREFAKEHPDVVDFTCRLQHVVRGYGQHAAGVCISDTDLRDGTKCNLVKRRGEVVCNWDKDDAEYMGLVKIDFLGLSALSRIHECLTLIEETTGDRIIPEDIPLDNSDVYAMIDSGDTAGIFQLGTYGICKLCKDLGIEEFKDLYNVTALYRPGPLGSGITEEFVARKNGKEYQHICPQMADITKDTYGCIVYQEQVMFACNRLGGMDWGKCDKIRKLMAKSKGIEALAPFKEEFVAGTLRNTDLTKTQAGELWDQLAEFGKYGFNKSHSVEYSVISYWDGWLKYHYPLQFFAAYLTYAGDDKKKQIMQDILDRGILIQLPKVGISKATRWQVNGDELIMPFSEIVGIGDTTAKQIEDSGKRKRVGFFGNQALSVSTKTQKILQDIKAFDRNYNFTYDQLMALRDYFIYDPCELFFDNEDE